MKVVYVSRATVENIDWRVGKQPVLISITENPLDPVNIKPVWDQVLRMYFDDINFYRVSEEHHDNLQKQFICFNEKHAKEILEFIHKIEGQWDIFVVHCEAGISRSAAVAKFIAEKYNLRFNQEYKLYNSTVYNKLKNVENEFF